MMKKMTTIRVDAEILKKAKELGLNVSKACETALKCYVNALASVNQEIECRGRDSIPRPPGVSSPEGHHAPHSPDYESGALTRLGYPGST